MPESEELIARLKALPLFTGLSEDELEAVAGLVEQSSFPPGTLIFKQGDPSDRFYIIESGQVSLTVHDQASAEAKLTCLGPGEFFGEVGLLKDAPRNATVVTDKATSLYHFSKDNFDELLARLPKLKAPIARRARVRALKEQAHHPWQLEDEVILLDLKRHWAAILQFPPIVALLTIVLIGLVVVVLMVGPGLILLRLALFLVGAAWIMAMGWHILDWRNDRLIVTNQRVLHIEIVMPSIRESRNEMTMDAIQNIVLVRNGPLAAWLDYADVRIQAAGGGGQIFFTYLPTPEAVQHQILQQRTLLAGEKQAEQLAAMRYALQKAINLPGAPPPPPPPATRAAPPPKPARALRRYLSNWMGMRIERDGQITWRKHWFVLLSQVFQPALAVLGGVAMFLFAGVLSGANSALVGFLKMMSVPVMLFGLGWFWWQWDDWRNDLYILTPTNIIDIERWPLHLHESRREGGLDRIQDINIELPDIWSNLFNMGNVRIKTAAAGGDFTFDHVADPRTVQRDIFRQLARYRRQQEIQQRQRQFEEMAQWFAVYNDLISQSARRPGGEVEEHK